MGDGPTGFFGTAAIAAFFALILFIAYRIARLLWQLAAKGVKALRRGDASPRKADGLLSYWPVYVTFPFFLSGMGKAHLTVGDLKRMRPLVSEGGMSQREAWNLLAFCGWTWFSRGEEAAEEFLKVAAAHYDRRCQPAGGNRE